MKQVLITGASGTVGHYVVQALLARGDCELHLVVRDPRKLLLPLPPERTHVLQADVRELKHHAETLRRMDAVVHLATAWGDPVAYDINVEATLDIARTVDPARCRKILYFSTASILNQDNRPMPEADTHGTDYIRSKYLAYQRLAELPNRDAVITLFPTLIFGGSPQHPISHLTRGLPMILRYLWVLRWFTLNGTLHFIHAADIARMVSWLLDHEPPSRDLVLGNEAVTVDALLDQLCAFHGLPRRCRLDLTPHAGLVAKLAGDRMNSWDRFSLTYQHFRYHATNPRALGMAPGFETIADILAERYGARPPMVLPPL